MLSRRRKFLLATIVSIASTVLTIGVCEAVFRVALFSESFTIPILKKARRYADPWADDDYYKLQFLFSSTKNRNNKNESRDGTETVEHDPELGWAPRVSSENPLGIITDTPYRSHDIRSVALFYGDSYVAGHTPVRHKIPQLLDRSSLSGPS